MVVEQSEEELESMKNLQNLKISEIESEAGEGAKEIEGKLLRALEGERKKHHKQTKELNGKILEMRKLVGEY